MTAPAPVAEGKSTVVIYVRAADETSAAPKKKAAKKPGAKKAPPNPTGDGAKKASPTKKASPASDDAPKSPKKAGKKATKKASTKPSPKKSADAEGDEDSAPKSPKSPKKAGKKPGKKPTSKPASPKSPKPPKESGEPEPAEEAEGEAAAPPPVLAAPPKRVTVVPKTPEEETVQDRQRNALIAFYKRHNPTKVQNIDDILKSWEGNFDLLMLRLKEKYEAPQIAAAHTSLLQSAGVASQPPAVVINPGVAGFHGSPQRSTPMLDPRLSQLAAEQEARLQREEQRHRDDVQTRLDATLRELQETRRREALEKEERQTRERRDREERDVALRRDTDRSLGERKALENLVRDREHAQRMREDDIERRDKELRRRQDDILTEREVLRRRELDSITRYEQEDAALRDRTEKMLSRIDPYSSVTRAADSRISVAEAEPLPGVAQIFATIQSETATLKNEFKDLQTQLVQNHTSVSSMPSPAANPETPSGGGGGASPSCLKPDPEFAPLFNVLTKAGLQKYAALFAAHQFDLAVFKKITDAELIELGITAVGARKRLIAEAEKQRFTASVSESVLKAKRSGAIQGHTGDKSIPLQTHSVTIASPFLPPPIAADEPPLPAPPPPTRTSPRRASPRSLKPVPGITYADYEATQSRLRTIDHRLDALATTGAEDQQSPRSTSPSPLQYADKKLALSQLEFHKMTLERFYETFDPVKVAQADQILSEYNTPQGLEALYATLLKLYDVEPSPYVPKIRDVCRRYHPHKEYAAGVLARVCQGREAELLAQLIEEGEGGQHFSSASSVGGRSAVAGLPGATEEYRDMQKWVENEDPNTGRVYYYSEVAKESQWSKPQVLCLRDTILTTEVKHMAASATGARDTRLPYSSPAPQARLPANPVPVEASQYASARRSVKSSRATHHRAWLLAFLLKNEPSRVPEVDSLLAMYAGRESELVESLQHKYGTRAG